MQFSELSGAALDLELNSVDSTNLYTSARREAAINQGLQEFADATECYIKVAQIAVTSTAVTYSLSTIADYSRLSAQGLPEYRHTSSGGVVTIVAGDDFPRRDELWLNRQTPGWRQSTVAVVPSAYFLAADAGTFVLGLNGVPDVGSSETAVIRLPYVARPPALQSSTDVPFSTTTTRSDLAPYHQALVHYAAFKLLPLTGDLQGAKGQLALYADYVTRYLQALRPKGGTHVLLGRDYLRDARRRSDPDGVPVTQWS